MKIKELIKELKTYDWAPLAIEAAKKLEAMDAKLHQTSPEKLKVQNEILDEMDADLEFIQVLGTAGGDVSTLTNKWSKKYKFTRK